MADYQRFECLGDRLGKMEIIEGMPSRLISPRSRLHSAMMPSSAFRVSLNNAFPNQGTEQDVAGGVAETAQLNRVLAVLAVNFELNIILTEVESPIYISWFRSQKKR
jgi:hypothetical protein